jgi:DMSO/TMAO reductase YedYZ molybdopterin-dependent catalytic subunit
MIDIPALHAELETAGLPIVGVSEDGTAQYSRELTPTEQTTAQAIITAHDPTKRERDERTARNQAKTYYNGLTAYLDLASPTGAQTVAAVKAIIRVLLWLLRNEFRT